MDSEAEKRGKGDHRFFKRILVATDFSEHAREAVETAVGIARACEPDELVLLHVFDVSGLPIIQSYPYYYGRVNKAMLDEIKTRAEKALKELAEPYLSEFPNASARVETGRTPFVILEAAREMDADLIILGVMGLGGGRSGMGSTAAKVIRRSTCPVLTAQHMDWKARQQHERAEAKREKYDRAKDDRRLKREARRRLKKEQRGTRRRFPFRRWKRGEKTDGVESLPEDRVGGPRGPETPETPDTAKAGGAAAGEGGEGRDAAGAAIGDKHRDAGSPAVEGEGGAEKEHGGGSGAPGALSVSSSSESAGPDDGAGPGGKSGEG